MMNVSVLEGEWDEGYVLDKHVLFSEYLGENEYGKTQFITKRTELGQLLYELKYQGKREQSVKIGEIISPFLTNWDLENKIDFIIPVPSSNVRSFQPVDVICDEISGIIKKGVCNGVLVKNSNNQSKNLTLEQKEKIVGTIERKKRFSRKVNVLLVDDLYQSGQTLIECVNALRNDENIDKIYVLCITKTKSR